MGTGRFALFVLPVLAALAVPADAQAYNSPNDAMLLCKNTASERMPGVPRAYIRVYRGTDSSDGYMINFSTQPRNAPPVSGFCNISWNGRLQNFQFDEPMPQSGRTHGEDQQNFGGHTPLEAMRSCKSTVSARFPSVPLAFIEVDPPRLNGGSLLSAFRLKEPNGLRASGSCDVFKNGRVNLTVR